MAAPMNTYEPRQNQFAIRFPATEDTLQQNEEWFECVINNQHQRMRIHDYDALFAVPGLYEELVYEKLACNSPETLRELLSQTLGDAGQPPTDLRVLDLGAGNGMVAEEIRKLGVPHIVGLDLLTAAKDAAERDRPNLYSDYIVADLCRLTEQQRQRLDEHKLNCLITVAALGFDDIPPAAFAEAFNLLSWNGWLGMTIKQGFLDAQDPSGFAKLLRTMLDRKILRIADSKRYCHRRSISGDPIYYVALVAEKLRDIPLELFNSQPTTQSKVA